MNINTVFLKNLDWWKTELTENPINHIGPACITAATTLLVAAVWNRYQALGFACMVIVSYPIAHHQIKYLMRVDLHETIYAVAIVGIQLFCRQFPHFSQLGLPMSVALAYAFTVRGMMLRHSLEEQRTEIKIVSSLNTELSEEIDLMKKTVDGLKKELETQANLVQEKQQLEHEEQETQGKKTIILSNFKTRLEMLANECQQFQVEELQALAQNDDHKQIVVRLSTLLDTVGQLKQNISKKETEMRKVVQSSLTSEHQIQNALLQLHEKLTA